MCIHPSTLDEEVTGSISQAAEQRRVHRELWNAVQTARTDFTYDVAIEAWNAHIREHRRQAAQIRAGRVK